MLVQASTAALILSVLLGSRGLFLLSLAASSARSASVADAAVQGTATGVSPRWVSTSLQFG
jgi:hypothetical protein